MATVALSFDSWKSGQVVAGRFAIQIVAPRTPLKLQPVSPRLKGELIHPNRTAFLLGVRYSSDGQRLIAGDYPGGVVVLWDIASGKQLTTIETGYGYRGSDQYFFLSPDWRTLFVSRDGRTIERIEKNGKRMYRWQFDGKVLAWDMGSGKLIRSYRHVPARNVNSMRMAPNGALFVTSEQIPGVYESRPPSTASLWETATGKSKALPEGTKAYGIFASDSRLYATTVSDSKSGDTKAIQMLDLPAGTPKWSLPVKPPGAWVSPVAFSPDSRLLVVNERIFRDPKTRSDESSRLMLLDAATGREVSELGRETGATFDGVSFGVDGRMLAAVTWRPPHNDRKPAASKLYLFSVSDKHARRVIVLETEQAGHRHVVRAPAISPDGKWVAVTTQMMPDERGIELDALDVSQARIHLVDADAGVIRETLIAPQGFISRGSFSPDGKTLATGGLGRVLLWDLGAARK
ncbi:MAG: WD40 repeat domain-containing protein [Planctomycetes bacterium]|nr:WD40 repeat domain-containing protein [Planctomycetota bacterium]